MSVLTLYHGSKKIISVPDEELSEDFNDFGAGFYLTQSLDAAQQWACTRGGDGFVNKYEIETDDLYIIDLCSEEYNILNWLYVVMESRKYRISDVTFDKNLTYLKQNFRVNISGADIIKGLRADEAYFFIARAFLKGRISLSQFKKLMDPGLAGEQTVLKSREAFRRLTFVSFEGTDAAFANPRRKKRNDAVLEAYFAAEALTDEEGLYISDMIEQEIKNDDERIQ